MKMDSSGCKPLLLDAASKYNMLTSVVNFRSSLAFIYLYLKSFLLIAKIIIKPDLLVLSFIIHLLFSL